MFSSLKKLALNRRRTTTKPRRRPSPILTVEVLEDRIVPQAYTVDTTNLNAAGPGQNNWCLQNAIANANANGDATNTITIAQALVNANPTISLGAPLSVTNNVQQKTLIINGNGAVINAVPGCQITFFQITNVTVSISSMTFQGGNTRGYGGAITSDSPLTLTRDTFTNNTAVNGGAIYDPSLSVTLETCTLSGNTATGKGGALCVGAARIMGSTFTGNNATSGGGIYAFGNINDVANNEVLYDAWAVVPLVVQNSQFNYNSAGNQQSGNTGAGNGGAIYCADWQMQVTESSTFLGNYASLGGAIYFSPNNNNLPGNSSPSPFQSTGLQLLVSQDTFSTNTAYQNRAPGANQCPGYQNGDGGALYVNVTTTTGTGPSFTGTVTNSTFNNNEAGRSGGAAFLNINGSGSNGSAQMTFNNSTLWQNTAANGPGNIGNGGGIDIKLNGASATVALVSLTVAGNLALGQGNGGNNASTGGGVNVEQIVGAQPQPQGPQRQVMLNNCIVSTNNASTDGSADVWGSLGSQGYNLVGVNPGILSPVAWLGTDLVGARFNPLLGALALNPGPSKTKTMMPQAGSAAIGNGNPAFNGQLDQRGVQRQVAPGRTSIGACDVTAPGAQPAPMLPIAANVPMGQTLTFDQAMGTGISVWDDAADAAGSDVTITLTSTNGNMALSQTSGLTFSAGTGTNEDDMVFSGTVADINAALEDITFTPTAIGSGSITMVVDDPVNGTNQASVPITITDGLVDVLPGSQTTTLQQQLFFSTANGNLVAVEDVPAQNNPVQVTLTAIGGVMTLNGTNGLSFSFSDGNGTGAGTGTADTSMTFRGTVADIDAALDGLTFTPVALGAGSIEMDTNDLGDNSTNTPQTLDSTVAIDVEPTNPTITWNNPADITYGTALGSSQLNATANVPGSFSYTLADGVTSAMGAVLSAGADQTLYVTFTPTDTTDYATDVATVSINVDQATPTITWNNPSAITYGTALGSTQLDATASVGGSFSYTLADGVTEASGAVLNAGSGQTLYVTFTPTDVTDYSPAVASVSINVNQAAPTVAVTDSSGAYTGSPFSASATVNSGASLEGVYPTLTYYNGTGTGGTSSSSAPTTAGTYTVVASFAGSTDYSSASSQAAFSITQASTTAIVASTGQGASALSFNGGNQYVDVPGNSAFEPTAAITVGTYDNTVSPGTALGTANLSVNGGGVMDREIPLSLAA